MKVQFIVDYLVSAGILWEQLPPGESEKSIYL